MSAIGKLQLQDTNTKTLDLDVELNPIGNTSMKPVSHTDDNDDDDDSDDKLITHKYTDSLTHRFQRSVSNWVEFNF